MKYHGLTGCGSAFVNTDLGAVDVQIIDLPSAKEDTERIEPAGNTLGFETGDRFSSIARFETFALGCEQSGSPD